MKKYSPSSRGFYDTLIHSANIPVDAVGISDELYTTLMVAQSQGNIISWNEQTQLPVAVDPPHPWDALDLVECMSAAHMVCCRNADMVSASLVMKYPSREQQTWEKQETEAREWFANNSAATPFIDAMLAAGVSRTKAQLVDDIIENADAFRDAAANVAGQRVAKCDAIKACTTVEQVKALDLTIITPVISLNDK